MPRVIKEKPTHGKKHNQKLKPYLVLQYLMRETDENNVRTADDIVAYLEEFCNIPAERRSIYEDIKAINRVLLMLEEECDIDEAIEMLEGEGGEEYKTVVYDMIRPEKAFMCAAAIMRQMIFVFWLNASILRSSSTKDRLNAW